MKNPKYYFIYYSCERTNWPANAPANMHTDFYQTITDKHPIQWQIDCNNLYDKRRPEGNGEYKEYYQIVNWQVLSQIEYDKFNGYIG